jgi:hypothetical protein
MMSSATSTDSSFRSWHFFVLAGLIAATLTVLMTPPTTPAALIMLSAAVGAGAASAFALHRTLWPLAASHLPEGPETFGRRTRAAIEREKQLVLRSIKELEFDRAMGKVSETDFHEMSGRLRARAMNLMRQLDAGQGSYREAIERELALRLSRTDQGERGADRHGEAPVSPRLSCASCGTANERDSRFCKHCGAALSASS